MSTMTLSMEAPPIPGPGMTLGQWCAMHEAAHRHFWGPRDTRIPSFLPRLTEAVCSLRYSLSQLRLAFDQDATGFSAFRREVSETRRGLHGEDPEGRLARLLEAFFARIDWREVDILEMMLEYLEGSAPEGPESLQEEFALLHALHREDRPAHDRAVMGLISEARGNLMGLSRACCSLRLLPKVFDRFDLSAVREIHRHLAWTMGLTGDVPELSEEALVDPGACWEGLYESARSLWQDRGVVLPLKPFEKASLYLLEAVPMAESGHAGFVRYLIENEGVYRRLLATCYAPAAKQLEVLQEIIDRYRRLPENAARPVHYTDYELRCLLFACLLRPDAVSAVCEREREKDIYRTLAGLPSRAYLPRVLHEVQNIFGYVTPESFQRITQVLGMDPVEIIRVIASFKQYSVDPGGSIIIYICKGTACFLRGQPELSRRLSASIQAREGEVGRHDIQFIEMDCFGVCHLAPVIRTRDVFLGKQQPDEIPALIDKLLKGLTYENRMSFLKRIRQVLAPGRESDPVPDLKIAEVIDPAAGKGPSLSPGTLQGKCLKIDASGQVSAAANGHSQILGKLLPNSFAFSYPTPQGDAQTGCVVADDGLQVRALVNFPEAFLAGDLEKSLKPQVVVDEGAVWLDCLDGPVRLGDYDATTLAVATDEGGTRLIRLAGAPSQAPPEQEEGLEGADEALEDAAFIAKQDRLVLGFAGGADPEDIDSYQAHGGYRSVARVLGLLDEPPWEPRRIIAEVASARLRGRGGAGFPTGSKWEAVSLAKCLVQEKDDNQQPFKLIVANGDEGDPGAFMDRTLIQEKPHQVIEGMLIAALAVDARYGVIYVRKEYEDAVRRLEHALFQARRKGFLGRDIFGVPGRCFDIDIRLGAGAFVAGEKRAIMRAIEGEPAEPTLNAPSNTQRGLWGKPTLLNNVETFANIPLIINKGGSWYARQGTRRSGGTKIFSVAGIVKRTGLVEVRFGRTLQDIIQICGGIQDGKRLAGVQIGGPSGAILSLVGVRSYLLYTPLDFDSFDQVGAMLGSGGLVFIGEDDDVVRLARHFTDWLHHESCGQCPPCLYGTVSLGKTLDAILLGEGTSDHVHALWSKSDVIKAGSQCGLGTTASNPVTSALRFFPHAFLHHLLGNQRLNRLECFRILEALRFLTREQSAPFAGRGHLSPGYAFTLKKHLFKHLVTELERLDGYRPAHAQRTRRFLDLLEVPSHEAGSRDVTCECSQVDYRRHLLTMQERSAAIDAA